MKYKGYKDLNVYKLAYSLSMEIFEVTKKFPKEEKYSLTDQIRRSSRSITANIAEGWKKRRYPKLFVNKLIDAAGEASETEVWLDYSLDCGYIKHEIHKNLIAKCDEINRMLHGMITKPEKFCGAA